MAISMFEIRATGKKIALKDSQLKRLHFNWSVSKLRDLNLCPLHFYFNRIVRLHKNPKAKIMPKPSMVFGKIIHELLYRFFCKKMKNGFKEGSMERIFSGVWHAFAKGEEFAGLKPDWQWSQIDFQSADQFWWMKEQGKEICRNFFYKNIHYFKDENAIRPLVEFTLTDYNFGHKGNLILSGKIDRLEFVEENDNLKAFLIDYKTGYTNYNLSYLQKDFQFTIYNWLYNLANKSGVEKARVPLKGMAIYPLKEIKNHEKLDLRELKQVPLRSSHEFSALENVIIDAKKRLEEYLKVGDFPANPGGYCQKLCPFEKQCSNSLQNYKEINQRFKNIANIPPRSKIFLPNIHQNPVTKQLILRFKKRV